MDYEPKAIPEGINASPEHPLKEFAVLVSALALILTLLTTLLVISADYLVGFIPVEQEYRWFSADRIMQAVDTDDGEHNRHRAQVESYLAELIDKLRDDQRPEFDFSVKLLREDTPNAFVMPAGNIVVTDGLLRMVDSENGLAMVLAHEMAHQYYRHPLRGLGRGVVISLALLVVGGFGDSGIADSFVGTTSNLTQLGFSREQEREADALGIELLVARYGHAGGSAEFFLSIRDQPEYESELPDFLSTHPNTDERIEFLLNHRSSGIGETKPLPPFVGEYLDSLES